MSTTASTSTSTKHKKGKSKKSRTTPIEPSTDSGKNEGVDLNWAYQPPPGAKPITTVEDNGEFDWDAVKEDDDVEVWVMRVPDNVKPKHLEGLSLDLSELSSSKKGKQKTSRIGTFKRKHISYDVWSLGDEDANDNAVEASHPHIVGGEEIKSLSCLLPRKSKKGKLYPVSKPIARHLIVSAQPPEPSTTENASTDLTTYKNPPRHKYPPELLKHRFMPYGSLVDPNYISQAVAQQQDAPMMEDETAGSAKKSKKAKTTSR
ncbi:hypothetical protein AN958_01681 [Leucoagaricus sp. SymC.cos]|nr:hypothetical protein AN958_01681 [Leucoagaricus sp. SymC.cos]